MVYGREQPGRHTPHSHGEAPMGMNGQTYARVQDAVRHCWVARPSNNADHNRILFGGRIVHTAGPVVPRCPQTQFITPVSPCSALLDSNLFR